jgi:hypothetical protein
MLSSLVLMSCQSESPPPPPPPWDPTACFSALATELSSDEMGGRGIGTDGLERAAVLLEGRYRAAGLGDAGVGHRQEFEAVTGVELGADNALGDGAPLALGQDWIPLGFSKSGEFSGEIVFAGYGIRAKDLGYDDYAGLDVKGKVVLALRYEPGENDEASPFEGKKPTRYSDLRGKAIQAREAGAAALILVAPPQAPDEPDKLPPLKTMGPLSDAGIPVLQVTRAQADRWLAAHGTTLAKAQAAIDTTFKPASFALKDARAEGRVDLHPVIAKTQNVVGRVAWLAVRWPTRSSSWARISTISAGAARAVSCARCARHPQRRRRQRLGRGRHAVRRAAAGRARCRTDGANRSLMFVGFSAEEIGLGGSAWFVDHLPSGRIGDVAAMINLDMVGRMNEHGKLNVLGADSPRPGTR